MLIIIKLKICDLNHLKPDNKVVAKNIKINPQCAIYCTTKGINQ